MVTKDTIVAYNQALENIHTLPLLPLKNVVILPKSIIPIVVGRDISIHAVEHALKTDRLLFVTAQKDQRIENPTIDDLFAYGTTAIILQEPVRMPNGALKILVESTARARMHDMVITGAFISAQFEIIQTTGNDDSTELWAYWRQLRKLYLAYTKLDERAPANLVENIRTVSDIDTAVDTIAVHSNLTFEERQAILEVENLTQRLLALSRILQREVDIMHAEQRIRGQVQSQIEQNQREYYLTEQIKAIQKELGREDQAAEIEELRKKLEKLKLPIEAQKRADKELRRLEQMPPLSSEASVSRHYIEWIMGLPWHTKTEDTISIGNAEKILNSNHAGLSKAKERIIEFIAAKKFSKKLDRSPILCLAGPPGVGKTSLAKSISDALGRDFVRIALGGVRDEAEIRGHRRTYIGALPGKIVQAMRKANTVNPVILLDEIDKMSRDVHGDPAAALLEVLDPEQNKTFMDHFLDLEYDLSQVMFIATANVIDNIPYPLFDRLEIINLSGYTDPEKCDIARTFLIPRNLKEHSLKAIQFRIDDDVLNTVIDQYTKEAGVRQLERVLTKLMRKAIQELLANTKQKSVKITPERVIEWLGNPIFKKNNIDIEKEHLGLATGLAWTEVGGDILEIETSVLPGKGGVTLTGQLGEVMQESAQAALSYIRSRAEEFGIKPSFHTSKDIHIHIPEGATPKDGPSAGITMCTALISALTHKPSRGDLAMTGEITLRGRVLAVGGLKEKLLAAKQHGLKMVIVPHENESEIKDIRKEISLDGLEIVFAKTMDDVIKVAFVKNPLSPIKPSKKKVKKKKQTTQQKVS